MGLVKIFQEMVQLDVKLESLQTPRVIDSEGMLFLRNYLCWLHQLKRLEDNLLNLNYGNASQSGKNPDGHMTASSNF